MLIIRKLQKCIQKIERESYDENVFLKSNRALTKFNFLFHWKSKTNLVTLRKYNSRLQYNKIDSSFSSKFLQNNFFNLQNICLQIYKIP